MSSGPTVTLSHALSDADVHRAPVHSPLFTLIEGAPALLGLEGRSSAAAAVFSVSVIMKLESFKLLYNAVLQRS